MTATGIEAVLCDVDGVVRLYHPDRQQTVEDRFAIPRGAVYRLAMTDALLGPLTVGRLDHDDWHRAIADALRPWCPDPEQAMAAVLAWRATSTVDEEVLALLGAAARHVPVALVTNGTTGVRRELDALGITAVVPTVVNSALVGVAKPDTRIFQHAATAVGVAPQGCLFVDDTAGHVAAAEALGMRGLHYRGGDGGRAALAALLGDLGH